MKKLNCVLLACLLTFSFATYSFAAQHPDEVFVTQELVDSLRDQTQSRIRIGENLANSISKQVVSPRSGNILNVPLLYQDDSRWANTYMPCGDGTYADYGCAVTSIAMAFRYYGYRNETPVTVASSYQAKYGDVCKQNINLAVGLKNLSVTAAGKNPSRSDLISAIVGGIINSEPTIVRVDRWGSHYFIAYGYEYVGGTDQYRILIRDPEGDVRYTNLQQYLSVSNCLSFATIG